MPSLHVFGTKGNSCYRQSVRPDHPRDTLSYFDTYGVVNEDFAIGPGTCVAEGTKHVDLEFGIDPTALKLFEDGYTASLVSANWTSLEVGTPVPGATTTGTDDLEWDPEKPLERTVSLYFLEGRAEGSFTVRVDGLNASAATHLNADFQLAGATKFGKIKFTTEESRKLESATPVESPKLSLDLPVGTTIWIENEEFARNAPRQVTFGFSYHTTQEVASQITHLEPLDTNVFAATDVQAIAKNGAPLVAETDLYVVEHSVTLDGTRAIGEMTERITVYDNTAHYDA